MTIEFRRLNFYLPVVILMLVKLGIHFATNTNYDLHRDAFLYYALGEHPDWGYVSVPPFIALVSRISVFLFGNTVFALRFFPAVVGSFSVLLIALIVKELKGTTLAVIIAATAFILSTAFLRSNTLFQPVSFNQFFWLLSAYLLLRLINTGNPKIWLLLFSVFGVAFMNKYSIAFFMLACFTALLLTGHRKLLWSKYFLLGCVIGMVIILPNILWQYHHNWPVITHMKELQQTQLVNVSLVGFFVDQLSMNFSGLIVWLTGLIAFLFAKSEKKYRVFSFIYLITIVILILLRGKSYYSLGLYSILNAMGGYAVDKYFRPFLKYGALALVVVLSFFFMPYSLPLFSHEKMAEISEKTAAFTNRWEDGKVHNLPQDYADMTGWKDVAGMVVGAYQELSPEQQEHCMIFAENYAIAGAILFYGKAHNLPEPVSFNDNFILWAPDSADPDVLLLVNWNKGDIEPFFGSVRQAGEIDNIYFRGNGLKVYICEDPADDFPVFYAQKVASLKQKY